MRLSFLSATALCALGCGGMGTAGGEDATPPALTTIAGAPKAGPDAVRVAVPTDSAPTVLSVLHGGAAVGTANGILEATLPDDALISVPFVDDGGDLMMPGKISSFVRRASGGLFAVSNLGIYTDQEGLFLQSPLTQTFAPMKVTWIDASVGDGAEELWLVADGGAIHVIAGTMTGFSIPGAAAPDAIAAVASSKAMVLAGGEAYFVDMVASTSEKLATGLGAIHGFDRGDDGTLYFALENGLLNRAPTGELALRTFAPQGAPAVPILAVAASFGNVTVASKDELIAVDSTGSTHLAPLTGALEHGVTTDATGDSWTLDGSGLSRFHTGKPVSFEHDVKPFITKHCAGCHKDGVNQAPKHDFESYDVTKQWADIIVHKLEGQAGMGVMPPAAIEKLAAADYAVVTRWVSSGEEP